MAHSMIMGSNNGARGAGVGAWYGQECGTGAVLANPTDFQSSFQSVASEL